METEARNKKQLEDVLVLQTHALNIDDEEEHPPKQQETPPQLFEVEAILKYEFKNKQLLEEAFTHNTYDTENNLSYERLEYIGDAVLNMLITQEHYFLYPNLSPGALTRLRSANVDTEKLARVAIKHELHRYLRHKKPLLEEQINEFTKAISEYPLHSYGLIIAPKTLADIVESAIGAVFIDSDKSFEIVCKVFKRLLEPMIDPNTIEKHPIAELQEYCQKNKVDFKFIDLWEESKSVEVYVNDKFVARGRSHGSKKKAQSRAAKSALDII